MDRHSLRAPSGPSFWAGGKVIQLPFSPGMVRATDFCRVRSIIAQIFWRSSSPERAGLIGISAVGSLVDTIVPGSLALPAQYIDLTGGQRASTFFGNGLVAHVSTAEPTCVQLTAMLGKRPRSSVFPCISGRHTSASSGPRLGTRAESHHMRLLGGQLVGMTNVPEAFLAREAQLCYSSIAVVTDFDCWQEDPSLHVSVDQVLDVYRRVSRAYRSC